MFTPQNIQGALEELYDLCDPDYMVDMLVNYSEEFDDISPTLLAKSFQKNAEMVSEYRVLSSAGEGIDYQGKALLNSRAVRLLSYVEDMSGNEKIVAALQREGFSITTEALLAANPDSVITRANIARFLYDSHQIRSVSEAFEKYIGDGCKCYVGRFKVSPMEAVELIHAAGGIAVLAHPLLYHMNQTTLQHLIDELKEVHLDGIEAIYSTYTTGEEQYVKRLAKENGLLISGGSDFHGTNKPTIQIGTGRGHLYIPYSILETIKEHLRA